MVKGTVESIFENGKLRVLQLLVWLGGHFYLYAALCTAAAAALAYVAGNHREASTFYAIFITLLLALCLGIVVLILLLILLLCEMFAEYLACLIFPRD